MSYYKDRENDESLIDDEEEEGPWLLEHVFLPKDWEKIFVLIFAPLFIIAFTSICYFLIFQHGKMDWLMMVIFSPLLLGVVILFIFSIVDIIRIKLIVDTEKITIVRGFWSRSMPLDDIAGYRVDKAVIILPTNPDRKKMRIPRTFKDFGLFAEWLQYNYQNLDMAEYVAQESVLIENSDYGFSEEQRIGHIDRARKHTRILDIAAVVLGGWFMLYPYPQQFLSVINILIPLIALAMLAGGNGLVRINQKKNDPYPSVFWGLSFPPIMLFMHAIMDTNIINYDDLWLSAGVITTILFIIFLKGIGNQIQLKHKSYYLLIYPLIAGVIFVYSASSIVLLNTAFDTSQPQIIQTKLINTKIHNGHYGVTTYSVAVGKLLPQQQEDNMDINVSKKYYNNVNTGDTTDIYIQKGLFNITWVKLEKEYQFHSIFGLI